jgi:hypothetical protein
VIQTHFSVALFVPVMHIGSTEQREPDMTAARSFLLVEYRHAYGSHMIPDTYTGGTIAELIGLAPMRNTDIMSVVRLSITSNGTVTEDISAEVCRALTAHYADDEDGIPEDWSELFRRVGQSLVDVNTDADIARAEDAHEWRQYQSGIAADYRRAAGY